MKQTYQQIWALARPYLRQGLNKDFVLHTEGVVKAMELLLKHENGDPHILIPAAILHDVGWAKVPKHYQRTQEKAMKERGMHLHIELAPPIIRTILKQLNYPTSTIKEIIAIVQSHKYRQPRSLQKRLLIDADQLSDSFSEQFYSDAKEYGVPPEKMYEYRMRDNRFYTATAKRIFTKELSKRRKEIG